MRPRAVSALTLLMTGAIVALSQTPISLDQRVEYHRPPSPLFAVSRVEIIFGGDMMFDRTVRRVMEQEGGDFILSCIDDVLQDADLAVANLEGPITDYPSMSAGSEIGAPENFTFTFPPETAALLKRHNIGLVNLGNNHINNFGEEGIRSTMVYLADNGVGFFGSPLQSSITRRTIERAPFEFISYNEFGGGGVELALHQIEFAKKEGFIPIVYTHWGEEYIEPPEGVKELAHSFIDAGAAIVIGSHSHIVQEHEIYRGKHIYYSLGNFIFDQYWNEAVSNGLLLKVTFTKQGVSGVEEIPISLERDRRTCITAGVKETILPIRTT